MEITQMYIKMGKNKTPNSCYNYTMEYSSTMTRKQLSKQATTQKIQREKKQKKNKRICPFSKRKKRKCQSFSRVQLFATPWNVACQATLSMEFSRQECWSGQRFSSAGDLPNPGIETRSPTQPADSLLSEPPGNQAQKNKYYMTLFI